MNREEIKTIIPHREPMLLVDEITTDESNVAHGKYAVRGDEWFLQGHFPGKPVVPGVILCEMMAQTCCLLLAQDVKGCTPYFTGIKNVSIRNKVLPGDLFVMEGIITKIKKPFYFAQCKGYVGDKLCISGEFSFALIREG